MIEEIKSMQMPKISENEEQTLRGSILFYGIQKEEIRILLVCLKSRKVRYAKGEVIFRQNDTENFMYAILAGTVNREHPIRVDADGDKLSFS